MIIYLFISIVPLKAWNRFWQDSAEIGTVRAPVICRNLDDNGFVSAAWWYHVNVTTAIERPRVKFLKVDDNGGEITKTEKQFYYGNTNNIVEHATLQKILPNPSEEGYLLLGTAHDPQNYNSARSFVMVLDQNLSVTNTFFFRDTFCFYDMEISPLTHRILLTGMSNPDDGLVCQSRCGVLVVLNQGFSTLSVNQFQQSLIYSGSIQRYDCIHALTIWTDTNNIEYVAVSGNITEPKSVGPFPPPVTYVPVAYVATMQLNSSGTITHQWYNKLVTDEAQQFIPADLIVDAENDLITVVGNISETQYNLVYSTVWSMHMDGSDHKLISMEGTPSTPFGVHQLHPYQIFNLYNGQYAITGWVPDYYTGTDHDGYYNFYYIKFDILNDNYEDIHVLLGGASNYLGTIPDGFQGTILNASYPHGGSTNYITVFHVPFFSTIWKDNNDSVQLAFAWIHLPNSSNNLEQAWRIKTTVSGTGDSQEDPENCQFKTDAAIIKSESPEHQSEQNPWSGISMTLPSVNMRAPFNYLPLPINCEGYHD